MLKSKYLKDLLVSCVEKNKNELEFLQSIKLFFQSIDEVIDYFPDIEGSGVLERFLEPERSIIFRVPWVDDQGIVQVNRGYRVQYNSAIGPYKGGLRFAENVDLSVMKFLAFEQTLKNALTGLPLGGGKGGADFSPLNKSAGEIMRFCQSYMGELYRHIGASLDVPAGDYGVGPREIGYLFGYYKKLTNRFEGAITGRGLSYGGSLARPEATGYGLCYFTLEMLKKYLKEDFTNKRVIISGSGQVGANAAVKAFALGAKVIAMSDIDGVIYNPKGINVEKVHKLKTQHGSILLYIQEDPNTVIYQKPEVLWEIACDIAFPCATQNELGEAAAKALVKNGVKVVAEGANMPCTPEAISYLKENNILFAPGKAANAGGVAVSGLEMVQAALHYSWSFEEVNSKLEIIMKDIFNKVDDAAKRFGKAKDLSFGANITGFLKIYEAIQALGVV